MSGILFTCSHCGQSLECDYSTAGQAIRCPTCKNLLQVPAEGETQHTGSPSRMVVQKQSSMACPSCGLPNISRCEMIYAQGTTTGTTSGSLIAFNMDGQGGIHPALIGGGSVGTHSQSLIAKQVAPPQQPTTRLVMFLLAAYVISIILVLVWFVAHSDDLEMGRTTETPIVIILGLVAPGIVGALASYVIGPSSTELRYPILMLDWLKSWKCLACGHRWLQEDEEDRRAKANKLAQINEQTKNDDSKLWGAALASLATAVGLFFWILQGTTPKKIDTNNTVAASNVTHTVDDPLSPQPTSRPFNPSADDSSSYGEATPKPTPFVKQFAPKGVYFLLQRVSVNSDSGIAAFDPGTQVLLVQDMGKTLRLRNGETEFEVSREQVTNELHEAYAAWQATQANAEAAEAWIQQQEQMGRQNEQMLHEEQQQPASTSDNYIQPSKPDTNPLDRGPYR